MISLGGIVLQLLADAIGLAFLSVRPRQSLEAESAQPPGSWRLGYSRSRFMLRMTREDVGSYLGLKLETVSRMLSHLQQEGVIQVQGKSIALLDFPALWRVSGTSAHHQRSAIDPILDRNGALMVAKEARNEDVRGLAM